MEVKFERQPTVTTDKNGYTEDQQREFITRTAQDLVAQNRQVQEEALYQDKNFIDSSRILYSKIEGANSDTLPDEEVVRWGLDYIGQVNYNLISAGKAAYDFNDATDMERIAMRYAMETYDAKDATWEGVSRFAKGMLTDPTTYIGIGTFGAGLMARGATKLGAKEAFIKSLMKPSNIAMMEGAGYGMADSAIRQNIEQDTGARQDFSTGEMLTAGAIGATAGKAIGVGAEYLGRKVPQWYREGGEASGDIYNPAMAGGGVPPQMDAPAFYSQLSQALEGNPQKTWNKQQLLGFLEKQGVKAEEMKWSGIQDYLDNMPEGAKIDKADLMDAVNQPLLEKKTLRTSEDDMANAQIEEERLIAKEQELRAEMRSYTDSKELYSENIDRVNEIMDEIKTVQEQQRKLVESRDFTNPVKYKQYSTQGVGDNYREELVTLKQPALKELPSGYKTEYQDWAGQWAVFDEKGVPVTRAETERDAINQALNFIPQDKGRYKSSHWDEPNVLYHVRKQDTTIDGDKTLLIEEIQSDWHQEGRKKWYAKTPEEFYREKALPSDAKWEDLSEEEKSMIKSMSKDGVPQAPYSKTWHEKAMKDQIAEAVEKGYDRVAWVAGKEQADRYSLAKQVDKIAIPTINEDGSRFVRIEGGDAPSYKLSVDKDGIVTGYFSATGFSGKRLDEVVGKEMAEKIMEAKEPVDFEGVDLEVGGEGMKGFYDKMLPNWTEKYIKKFGAKLEVKKLPNGQEVWSFPVTDKMKSEVKGKGQALYATVAGLGAAGIASQQDNQEQ